MNQSILFVMDYYGNPYAGTEGQVLKLVEGLRDRGWTVRFAVFRPSEYVQSGKFPVPVEVIGIDNISSLKSWLKLYRFARKAKDRGVSLVHVFFNDASVMVPPVFQMLRVPVFISRRDMGFWYTKVLRYLLPLTGRFITGCICNSEAVKAATESVEKIAPEKLHVIYNGYLQHEKGVGKGGDFKPLTPGNRVIGLVANLRPIKRIEDLIKATSLLQQRGYLIEAHIIGGGDQAPYLELASSLGVEGRCRFWGSQKQPEKFLPHFDVAVLCSESEGFSNAIIEYMRAGKPVVCTRTGGNPEIIDDGLNGYLVNVGDTEALADRIADLLDNPSQAKEFGLNGQKKVGREYSMERMINAHESLYQCAVRQVNYGIT